MNFEIFTQLYIRVKLLQHYFFLNLKTCGVVSTLTSLLDVVSIVLDAANVYGAIPFSFFFSPLFICECLKLLLILQVFDPSTFSFHHFTSRASCARNFRSMITGNNV